MSAQHPFHIAISKEAVASMPVETFEGAITVVDTPADAAEAIRALAGEDVVGFDTETKPNFRKGQTNRLSLIQISTADRCYLFRVNKTGLTPDLIEFLQSPLPVKVGLSLKDDFHGLQRLAPLTPAGFEDLQDTVKHYDITDASLQKIYAILFGRRISKGQRLTNWEAPLLTPAQMMYASLDAWSCLRIHRLFAAGGFDPALSPWKVFPDEGETR
ncbi:MAG: 3'-5' exonuclease domain-containing protein 2 [Duncaniella sp.]|nr:3'-5' exonuclease domain-containing protein 2 [Duncaniella sp.]